MPEPVGRLAQERGLGPLVDVRHEMSTSGALIKGGGTAVAALGLMTLSGYLLDGVENGIVTAIVRPALIALLGALVWGVIVAVRGLVVGSRAHYLFAGGLVAKRRSGLIAVAWPDVEMFETRYNRKTREIVSYRVHAGRGVSFDVPLVLTDHRDAFVDRIADEVRAHGRPVR